MPPTELRWLRMALRAGWRVLRLVLLVMLTLAGLLCLFQEKLLHFPEVIDLAAAKREAVGRRLVAWPASGECRGWLRQPEGAVLGTVVVFHGNGGHALQRSWLADIFERHGFRTLLAEHPAYGHRAGSMDEASLSGDAAETLRRLKAEFPGKLLVVGESLGAGVAAAAVAQTGATADAVLLATPWNTLAAVAAQHYPWLPVRLLLHDRYDSIANLRQFRGPKAFIVAGDDRTIPPALGVDLYQNVTEPKLLLPLPGSGHNDWMEFVSPAQWESLIAFLTRSPLDNK